MRNKHIETISGDEPERKQDNSGEELYEVTKPRDNFSGDMWDKIEKNTETDETKLVKNAIEKTDELIKNNFEDYTALIKDGKDCMPLKTIRDIVQYLPLGVAVLPIAYFEATKVMLLINTSEKFIGKAILMHEDIFGRNEMLDKFVNVDIKSEINSFLKENLDVFKVEELKETEAGKLITEVTEIIVDAVKAIVYLVGKALVGIFQCAENVIDFLVGGATWLAGYKEVGQAVYEAKLVSHISEIMDEFFDEPEIIEKIGNCIEKIGQIGTYVALGILSSIVTEGAAIPVVATAVLATAKAGEATRNSIERTGNFSEKELLYGAIHGIFTVLLNKVIPVIAEKSMELGRNIAKTVGVNKVIQELVGNVIKGSAISGAYEIPTQIIRQIQDWCDLNLDEDADWKAVPKSMLVGGLFSAAVFGIKELKFLTENNYFKKAKIIKDIKNGKIELKTKIEKGNAGEIQTDLDMMRNGYERISNDEVTSLNDTTHQGIDGVYRNRYGDEPKYVIADAKYGTAGLADTSDGKQMSMNWINNRLDDSVGKNIADEIRELMLFESDNVMPCVAHIDENMSMIYDKLDASANVVARDVRFNA